MADPKKKSKFTFRQDWNIGSAAAEQDDAFLAACFVDTGLLAQIINTSSNKSIVLGRVGAGKSALLREIGRREKNVASIDPQDFSLRYISNSNTLQFVSSLGVKLDPVFQALWKHVLCVELIRLRYNVSTSSESAMRWGQIISAVSFNESRKRALQYFADFGGTDFWQTTEVRVREITKKIEEGIEESIGGKARLIELGARGHKNISDQERSELVSNIKTFLDSVHMSALQQVINILSEGDFSKTQGRFYVVIDDLDTQWADNDLRYRLIRALIEVIKRFREIRCVKIVISLRTDLLATVLDATRDSGFQEEKFDDFFLRVRWADVQLKNLVDLRLNELIRHKYSGRSVAFYDLFPRQIRKLDTLEYIIRRTMKRPRDIILFINECFQQASGRTDISPSTIQDAEREYSTNRLKSIQQEWFDIYPQLGHHLEFLKSLRSRTIVSELPVDSINQHLLSLADFDGKTTDPVSIAGLSLLRNGSAITTPAQALPYLRILFGALFRVGAIAIKRPPAGRFVWNDDSTSSALAESVELDSVLAIHPMLYGGLGTYVLPESQ